MKTRHVIGQRIVAVDQGWQVTSIEGDKSPPHHVVFSLTLSNGAKLICHAHCTPQEPLGTLILNEEGLRSRRCKGVPVLDQPPPSQNPS